MTTPAESRRSTLQTLVDTAVLGFDVGRSITVAASRVQVDQCTACRLHETATNHVPWSGEPSSIILVGEAPGAQEDAEGLPFVGRSGELLRTQLEVAGVESFALANTICCRPPGNDFSKALEFNAVNECTIHLEAAMEASGAWIVISVGGKSAKEFGWGGTVGAAVGKWRWIGDRLHTTIWHPSYLLRMGDMSSKKAARSIEVLREARRASEGYSGFAPDPSYTSVTATTIGSDGGVDMVRTALNATGYVPIYSKVLGANVVVYDPARVTPMSSIKLPPGFEPRVWFTVKELAILSHPEDVRRMAALKEVVGGEVVA